MKLGDLVRHNLALKMLSLFLALLLWLFVSNSMEREKDFTLPVLLENVPPGLQVANNLPKTINIRLKGQKIILWKVWVFHPLVRLDLKDAAEGTIIFPTPAAMINLPEGAKPIRIMPATIEVRLIRIAKQGKDN